MKKPNILYCTYFNKNYLIKGLALHASLIKHEPHAKLHILCMDDYTKSLLDKMKLKGVTTIAHADFQDQELAKARSNRSLVEYFWTCTPSLPRYIIKEYPKTNLVVYLDADLYFYDEPVKIFQEMGNNSIYIVEHRYPQDQKYRDNISGRFNVGIIVFKNDQEGRACIEKWRSQCNEWCYLKSEPDRFGDQLYLNKWPSRYKKVTISKNLGINAAPWNITQYEVTKKGKKVYINDDTLMIYHFHQLAIHNKGRYTYAHGYHLSPAVKRLIYKPYTDMLTEVWEQALKIDPGFTIDLDPFSLSAIIKKIAFKYIGNAHRRLRKVMQA